METVAFLYSNRLKHRNAVSAALHDEHGHLGSEQTFDLVKDYLLPLHERRGRKLLPCLFAVYTFYANSVQHSRTAEQVMIVMESSDSQPTTRPQSIAQNPEFSR